jgi:hypothetical protein
LVRKVLACWVTDYFHEDTNVATVMKGT